MKPKGQKNGGCHTSPHYKSFCSPFPDDFLWYAVSRNSKTDAKLDHDVISWVTVPAETRLTSTVPSCRSLRGRSRGSGLDTQFLPILAEELRDARVRLLAREAVDGVRQGDGEDARRERCEELGCHVDGDDTSETVRHDGYVTRGRPFFDDVFPNVAAVFLGSFTVSHWNAHAVDYAVSIVSVEHNDGVTEPLRSPNVRQLSAFFERVVDDEPPRPLTGSHDAAAMY
ncbi:hypothetical protein MRX96_022483 [Rhipicephalus microplus]